MPRKYNVLLQDNDGETIAVLENVSNPKYQRRLSEATAFSFSIPHDDEKAQYLTLAARAVLLRDGVEKIAGRIKRRDFGKTMWSVQCMSNEIYLSSMFCPADWPHWNGLDLGQAVKDLALWDFRTFARNTQDDYANAVESYQVDITTEPGTVWLGQDVDGRFYPSGYITLEFDFGAALENREVWLRWGQEIGEVVTIGLQHRTSADGSSWTSWDPSSAPGRTDVAEPEKYGYNITVPEGHRYLQVKVNLETEDTESENENGDPQGFSPVFEGLEVIYRVAGPLTEGVINTATGITLEGVEPNRQNHLRIIKSLCDEYGYEFYVDGSMQFHFDQTYGQDLTNEVVLRNTDNMAVSRMSDDDSKLVNVLDCYGAGRGPSQIRTTLTRDPEDPLSVESLGVIYRGVFQDKDAETIADLEASGQEYLDEHSANWEFKVTTYIDDDWPDISVGDWVKVVDPHTGLVQDARIEEDQRSEGPTEKAVWGLNTQLVNPLEVARKGLAALQPTKDEEVLTPPTPYQLRITNHYAYLVVRWSGDGDSFDIFHSTDGVEYRYIANVTGKSYHYSAVEPGETHYFKVQAIRAGRRSAMSEAISATVRRPTLDELGGGTPDNLITNPWFEFDTDGDGVPDDWELTLYSGQGGEGTLDPSQSSTGTQSLKLRDAYVKSLWLPASPEEKFYVRADVRAASTNTDLYIGIQEFDAAKSSLRYNYGFTGYVSAVNTWERKEGQVTVGPDTKWIRILLVSGYSDTGDSWFDNVVLKRVTTTDGLDDGSVTTGKVSPGAITEQNIATIVDDSIGTSWITSSSFVDIPGMVDTFTLDEESAVFIHFSANAEIQVESGTGTGILSYYRLVVDDNYIEGTMRGLGHYGGDSGKSETLIGNMSAMVTVVLPAGTHTVKAQCRRHTSILWINSKIRFFSRALGHVILKR